MHAGGVGLGVTSQHGLREGRPLVRQVRLVADEDDATLEARGSRSFRGLRAGKARAHDDEARPGGHDVNLFGNWVTMPSASVSAISRMWSWTASYAAMSAG